jgi:hypothetical protein
MPGAFRTGIVKNQQGLAAEVLKIKASYESALLNWRRLKNSDMTNKRAFFVRQGKMAQQYFVYCKTF